MADYVDRLFCEALASSPATHSVHSAHSKCISKVDSDTSDEEEKDSIERIRSTMMESEGTSGDEEVVRRVAAQLKIFRHVTKDCSVKRGKHVSISERKEKGFKSTSLTYGEIPFVTMALTLEKIKSRGGVRKNKSTFYDLGSGTGKACFAASLLQPFRSVVGIEFLSSLHEVALETKLRFDELPREAVASELSALRFVCGDIISHDWSDADVCFANTTCFKSDLMRALAKKSEKMKKGSWFVTTTKTLDSDHWEVVESIRYKMSWGFATLFHQRKVK